MQRLRDTRAGNKPNRLGYGSGGGPKGHIRIALGVQPGGEHAPSRDAGEDCIAIRGAGAIHPGDREGALPFVQHAEIREAGKDQLVARQKPVNRTGKRLRPVDHERPRIAQKTQGHGIVDGQRCRVEHAIKRCHRPQHHHPAGGDVQIGATADDSRRDLQGLAALGQDRARPGDEP